MKLNYDDLIETAKREKILETVQPQIQSTPLYVDPRTPVDAPTINTVKPQTPVGIFNPQNNQVKPTLVDTNAKPKRKLIKSGPMSYDFDASPKQYQNKLADYQATEDAQWGIKPKPKTLGEQFNDSLKRRSALTGESLSKLHVDFQQNMLDAFLHEPATPKDTGLRGSEVMRQAQEATEAQTRKQKIKQQKLGVADIQEPQPVPQGEGLKITKTNINQIGGPNGGGFAGGGFGGGGSGKVPQDAEKIIHSLLPLSGKTEVVHDLPSLVESVKYAGHRLEESVLGIGHDLTYQIVNAADFGEQFTKYLSGVLPQAQQDWLNANVFTGGARKLFLDDKWRQETGQRFLEEFADWDGQKVTVDPDAQFIADVLSSPVDQLPQILLGFALGPAAGLGYMFHRVYSNTQQQLLQEGYAWQQATQGALAAATLEDASEMLSGGVPGLGKGILSKGLQGLVLKAIDKAIPSIAKDKIIKELVGKGLDIIGEGFEEYLVQGLQDAVMAASTNKTAWFGETFNDIVGKNWNSPEAWRAAYIGALSSLIMEGSNKVIGQQLLNLTKETALADVPQEAKIAAVSEVLRRIGANVQVDNYDPMYEGATLPPDAQGKQTVVLNLNQPRDLAEVVVHETTHIVDTDRKIIKPLAPLMDQRPVGVESVANEAVISTEEDLESGKVIERTIAQEKAGFLETMSNADRNTKGQFNDTYDDFYARYKEKYELPDNDVNNRTNQLIVNEMFAEFVVKNTSIESIYRMLGIAPKSFMQMRATFRRLGMQMAGTPMQQYAYRMQAVFEHAVQVKMMSNEMTNQQLEKAGLFRLSTRNVTPLSKALYFNTAKNRYEKAQNVTIQNASNTFTRNGVTVATIRGEQIVANNPRIYTDVTRPEEVVQRVLKEFANKASIKLRNLTDLIKRNISFDHILENHAQWEKAKKDIGALLEKDFGFLNFNELIEDARKDATILAENGFAYSFNKIRFSRSLEQRVAVKVLEQNGYDDAIGIQTTGNEREAIGAASLIRFSLNETDHLGVPLSPRFRTDYIGDIYADKDARPYRFRSVETDILDQHMSGWTHMPLTKFVLADTPRGDDVYLSRWGVVGDAERYFSGSRDHVSGIMQKMWDNEFLSSLGEDDDGLNIDNEGYLVWNQGLGGDDNIVEIPETEILRYLVHAGEEYFQNSTLTEVQAINKMLQNPFTYPGLIDGLDVTRELLDQIYDFEYGEVLFIEKQRDRSRPTAVYVFNDQSEIQATAVNLNQTLLSMADPNAVAPEYKGVYEEPTESTEFYMDKIQKSWMPGFTSTLFETLKKKMQNRASVKDVINMATSGIQQEEYEWSGLQDYLESLSPTTLISKAAVFKVISENPIKIVVEKSQAYSNYVLPGATDYQSYVIKIQSPRITQKYHSSHYGDYAMVHIRTYRMKDENGVPRLMAEEWQSDWHQQGRDNGYADSKETILLKRDADAKKAIYEAALQSETRAFNEATNHLPIQLYGVWNFDTNELSFVTDKKYEDLIIEINEAGFTDQYTVNNLPQFLNNAGFSSPDITPTDLHLLVSIHTRRQEARFARNDSLGRKNGILVLPVPLPGALNGQSGNARALKLALEAGVGYALIKKAFGVSDATIDAVKRETRARQDAYDISEDAAQKLSNASNRGIANAPYKNNAWADLAIKIIMKTVAENKEDRLYVGHSEIHTRRWGGTLNDSNAVIARRYLWKYDAVKDAVNIQGQDYTFENYKDQQARPIDPNFPHNPVFDLGDLKGYKATTPETLKELTKKLNKKLSDNIADANDMAKVYEQIKKTLAEGNETAGELTITYPEYKFFRTSRSFGFQGFYDNKLMSGVAKMMRKFGISPQMGYLSDKPLYDSRALPAPVAEPTPVQNKAHYDGVAERLKLTLQSLIRDVGSNSTYVDQNGNIEVFTAAEKAQTLALINTYFDDFYQKVDRGANVGDFMKYLRTNAGEGVINHFVGDFYHMDLHTLPTFVPFAGVTEAPKTIAFWDQTTNALGEAARVALNKPKPKPTQNNGGKIDIKNLELYPDPRANLVATRMRGRDSGVDKFTYFELTEEARKSILETPFTLFAIAENYQDQLKSALQVRLERDLKDNMSVKQVLGIINAGKAEEGYWSGLQEYLASLPEGAKVKRAEVLEHFNKNAIRITKTSYSNQDRYGFRPQDFAHHLGENNYREIVYEARSPLMSEILMPSAHWENHKDVFVHLRLSDLRPHHLLIEEVQSDVHQLAQRTKRYADEAETIKTAEMGRKMDAKRNAVLNHWFDIYKRDHGISKGTPMTTRVTIDGVTLPVYGDNIENAIQTYVTSHYKGQARFVDVTKTNPNTMGEATIHDLAIHLMVDGMPSSVNATAMEFASQAALNKILTISLEGVDPINGVNIFNIVRNQQTGEMVSAETQDAPYKEWYMAMVELFKAYHAETKEPTPGCRVAAYSPMELPYRKDLWWEFAFRESIKTAVEEGYDRVYLTRGIVHAMRYDTSATQVVKALRFDLTANGIPSVEIIEGDKQSGYQRTTVAITPETWKDQLKKYADLLNDYEKERVDAYFANPTKPVYLRLGEGRIVSQFFGGRQLLYDSKMVDYANKFVKAYGTEVKYERINMDGLEYEIQNNIQFLHNLLAESVSSLPKETALRLNEPLRMFSEILSAKRQATEDFLVYGYDVLDILGATQSQEAKVQDLLYQLQGDVKSLLEATRMALDAYQNVEAKATFAQDNLNLAMDKTSDNTRRPFALPYIELNDEMRGDIEASGTPLFAIADLTKKHQSKLMQVVTDASFPDRIKVKSLVKTLEKKGVKKIELDWHAIKEMQGDENGFVTKEQIIGRLQESAVSLWSRASYGTQAVRKYELGTAADDERDQTNRVATMANVRQYYGGMMPIYRGKLNLMRDTRMTYIYEANEVSKRRLGIETTINSQRRNESPVARHIVSFNSGIGLATEVGNRWGNYANNISDEDTFFITEINPTDVVDGFESARKTMMQNEAWMEAAHTYSQALDTIQAPFISLIKSVNRIPADNPITHHVEIINDKPLVKQNIGFHFFFDHQPTREEIKQALLTRYANIDSAYGYGVDGFKTISDLMEGKDRWEDTDDRIEGTTPPADALESYRIRTETGTSRNDKHTSVGVLVYGDTNIELIFKDSMRAKWFEPNDADRPYVYELREFAYPTDLEANFRDEYDRYKEVVKQSGVVDAWSKLVGLMESFGTSAVAGVSAFANEQFKAGVREAVRLGVLSGVEKVAFTIPLYEATAQRYVHVRGDMLAYTQSDKPGFTVQDESTGYRKVSVGTLDAAIESLNGVFAESVLPLEKRQVLIGRITTYFNMFMVGLTENLESELWQKVPIDPQYKVPQISDKRLAQLDKELFMYVDELLQPYSGVKLKLEWVGPKKIKMIGQRNIDAWINQGIEYTERALVMSFTPTTEMREDIRENGVPLFSLSDTKAPFNANKPVGNVDSQGYRLETETKEWLQNADRQSFFKRVKVGSGAEWRAMPFYTGSQSYPGGEFESTGVGAVSRFLNDNPYIQETLPWLKAPIFLSDDAYTASVYAGMKGETITNDLPFKSMDELNAYMDQYPEANGSLRATKNGGYTMLAYNQGNIKATSFANEQELLEKGKFAFRKMAGVELEGIHAFYVGVAARDVDHLNMMRMDGEYNRFDNAKNWREVPYEGKPRKTDDIVIDLIKKWVAQASNGKSVSPRAVLFHDLLDAPGSNYHGSATPSNVLVVFNNDQVTPLWGKPKAKDKTKFSLADDPTKTRSFPQTVLDSGVVRPIVERDLDIDIREGRFDYQPHTDKAAWNLANARLEKDGKVTKERLDGAFDDFNMMFTSGRRMDKNDVVMAELLVAYYSQTNFADSNKVMDLITSLAIMGTELGRQVQALNMIRRLGPQGQLMAVMKAVKRMEGMYEVDNKILIRIHINEDLAAELMQQTDQKGIDIVIDKMKQDIADQLPMTWERRIDAWRYLAMLGNPRTHIRNILGNSIFVPLAMTKDVIASMIEEAASHIEIKPGKSKMTNINSKRKHLLETRDRAHAIINPFNARDKALLQYAENHWRENQDAIMAGGKYDFQRDIKEKQTTFKTKWLEAFRAWNFKWLEKEDAFFLHLAFRRNMAQFIKARGWTLDTMTERRSQLAANYAIDEAKKLTFRDASAFANQLNYIERTNKVAGFFIKTLAPFKKTPLNIMKRGVEYSPVSILTTVPMQLSRLKKGDINTSEFIDTISAGLTGTAIFMLGAFLMAQGILRVDEDEPDREKAFQNARGRQIFSIQWGDQSYTIDWMVPAVMPLFMGAQLAAYMQKGTNSNPLYFAPEAVVSIFTPVFELTMLQGLMDTIQSFNTSPAAMAGEALTTIGANYVGQFLPTLGGQIARTIDPIRRSTTAPKDSPINPMLESILRRLANKIPGLSQLNEPIIDMRGEPVVSYPDLLLRVLMNFASPGYYAQGTANPIDEKIKELYDKTNNPAVFPRQTPSTFNNDGYPYVLTPSERTAFAKELGTASYTLLKRTFDSGYYRNSNLTIQQKLVADTYEYAYFKAKDTILTARGLAVTDKWYQKIKEGGTVSVSPTDYLIAKSTYDNMEVKTGTKKDAYAKALIASGYTRAAIKYLMTSIGGYTIDRAYERRLDYMFVIR